VGNGFPPSGQWGTEYYTHQLATGLAARGVEVQVLHPVRDADRPRFDLRRTERYGLEVFELANRGDAQKRFDDSYACDGVERVFAELLDRERPDVVHFTHLLWGLSVRLPGLAKARGARTVVTATDFGLVCHRGQLRDWRGESCAGPTDHERCARCVREPGAWDHAPLRRGAQRLAVGGLALVGGAGRVVMAEDIAERVDCVRRSLASVDHWIFPTRALQDELAVAGVAPRSASQLYYGIDETAYERPRVARGAGGVRFVFMSQYMPHKGLACLLEAVRLLERRLPESVVPWRVHLHGNGTGGRGRRYADEVLAHPLPRRVTDCGPFEPLLAPEVLASSDCVVVPSEWRENAPLTVLQARAAGVPVLASDVPGVREVLEPGRHGLLFQPGDAAGLAEGMAAVLRGELDGTQRAPVVRLTDHLDAVQALHAGGLGRRRAEPLAVATP